MPVVLQHAAYLDTPFRGMTLIKVNADDTSSQLDVLRSQGARTSSDVDSRDAHVLNTGNDDKVTAFLRLRKALRHHRSHGLIRAGAR